MKKTGIYLFSILLLAAVAAFFVYPQGFGGKVLPWRLGLDLVGGSFLVYEVDVADVVDADRSSVFEGLRDVMERRVNAFGVSEPRVTTARVGDSYQVIVELAGISDTEEAIQQIGRTALLDFREVVAAPDGGEPRPGTGREIEPEEVVEEEPVVGEEGERQLHGDANQPEFDFNKTDLTGRYLTRAQVGTNQNTNQPVILIDFDSEGGRIFEELTERNIGRPLAIFLDDELISAPVVQNAIPGGSAQISGGFSFEEARQLVSLFNAGALPAPVTLISEQTIGATLGLNSLNKALIAGALGTLAIMLFMVIYYRKLGWVAVLALLLYIVFTLTFFKLFGITMTLAGIAGLILSIGMAVDANILIFSRTREELAKGVAQFSAIEDGFRRAWPSIRDSNITTMLTSIILYYLTSSFVRGFALALFIGVIISMFSAITITRVILRATTKQ